MRLQSHCKSLRVVDLRNEAEKKTRQDIYLNASLVFWSVLGVYYWIIKPATKYDHLSSVAHVSSRYDFLFSPKTPPTELNKGTGSANLRSPTAPTPPSFKRLFWIRWEKFYQNAKDIWRRVSQSQQRDNYLKSNSATALHHEDWKLTGIPCIVFRFGTGDSIDSVPRAHSATGLPSLMPDTSEIWSRTAL